MPRLIFEGDVTNSLGDKFPTVYFSNISVFDDRIELELNCFVEDVVLEEMRKDLNLYIIPVYKQAIYESILANPNNLIEELESIGLSNQPSYSARSVVTAEGTLFDAEAARASSTPGGGMLIGTNYFEKFLIDEFDEVGTRNYNSNDNQYYKLVLNRNLSSFDELLSRLEYVSFVAFTSFLTPQDFANITNYNSFVLDQVSKISHTKVIEDTKVVNETFNAYLLGGIQFQGKVIQDLNNGYRVNSQQQFTNLLSEIRNTNTRFSGTGDRQLQSFVDSCSYITATQSMEVDFLKQIKSVLDSFPSRTSTSPIGVYYNSLKTLIFSFNDFLLTQQLLEKKIINTVHNFDFRDTSIFELSEIFRVPYDGFYNLRNSLLSTYNEEFIYNSYMDRTRRIPVELLRSENIANIVDQELGICYNHSYFLFDYEKALYKTSNISQIFNVDEILVYFGENSLSRYFQFSNISYGRAHTHPTQPNTAPFGCFMLGRFNQIDFTVETNASAPPLILNTQTHSDYAAFPVPSSTPDIAGREKIIVIQEENSGLRPTETLKSFIAQRSFDTIETIGDYKLACFEVSDIQTKLNMKTAYRFRVLIKDYTINFLIQQIIEPAKFALRALRRYYDLASDFCSYNDLDNKFNDFFIEYIEEVYANMRKPPWELAPIWFNIIKNLLTREQIETTSENLFNSVTSLIIKISPNTGNLDNIASFIQQFENLMTTFEEGGQIYEQIYGGSNADGTRAGVGLIDNINNVFVRNFEDLPAILDNNVMVYDRVFDQTEEGAEALMSQDFEIRAFNGVQTRNSAETLNFIFNKLFTLANSFLRFGATSIETGVIAGLDDLLSPADTYVLRDEKMRLAYEYIGKRAARAVNSSQFRNTMNRIIDNYIDKPNQKRDGYEKYKQRLKSKRKDMLRAQKQLIINTLAYARTLVRQSPAEELQDAAVVRRIFNELRVETNTALAIIGEMDYSLNVSSTYIIENIITPSLQTKINEETALQDASADMSLLFTFLLQPLLVELS